MKNTLRLLFLCSLTIAAGCVEQVPVTLTSGDQATSAVSASESTGKKIYLAPFEDNRAQKEALGRLQNGLFRSTHIVLENDAASSVTSSVKRKLEERGYAVVMASPDEDTSDAPLIKGQISDITCCKQSLISGAVGKISLDTTMTFKNSQPLDKVYNGEGSKRATFFYGKNEFEAAVSDALDSAVQQLVDDVQAQAL